jgi:lysozyme
MSNAAKLLGFEEGYRDKPYYCTEGFPTAGIGQRLGPRHAPLSQYQFTVPRTVAEVWVRCHLDDMVLRIETDPAYAQIRNVLNYLRTVAYAGSSDYEDPRIAVLLSMGYQMGLDGLAQFKNTLKFMQQGDFIKAAVNMLASKWAQQTPNRAKRHAEQMRSGKWCKEYPA